MRGGTVLRPSEKTACRHLQLGGGIDLLQADYYQQHFSRHTHDGYAFGIITRGELDFSYRHQDWQAQPGDINLVVPGEAHDGRAKDAAGWSYRMIYLPAGCLKDVAGQLDGRDQLPWFRPGSIADSQLAAPLMSLYGCLSAPAADILQQESQLTAWLAAFIHSYGDQPGPVLPAGHEALAIARAAAYLEAHFDQPVSLRALAAVVHFSPWYLLRSFEKTMGLPPHLYQQLLRVRRAKAWLQAGIMPAEVAARAGFADQSHFTRQFRQLTGLTPRRWQKMMET
jgi:AraC-like DNA-binding protein